MLVLVALEQQPPLEKRVIVILIEEDPNKEKEMAVLLLKVICRRIPVVV